MLRGTTIGYSEGARLDGIAASHIQKDDFSGPWEGLLVYKCDSLSRCCSWVIGQPGIGISE